MEAQSLGSELYENLRENINNPIYLKHLIGDLNIGNGHEAEVLVDVCKDVIRSIVIDEKTKLQIYVRSKASSKTENASV